MVLKEVRQFFKKRKYVSIGADEIVSDCIEKESLTVPIYRERDAKRFIVPARTIWGDSKFKRSKVIEFDAVSEKAHTEDETLEQRKAIEKSSNHLDDGVESYVSCDDFTDCVTHSGGLRKEKSLVLRKIKRY